jgi:hypothetical protein
VGLADSLHVPRLLPKAGVERAAVLRMAHRVICDGGLHSTERCEKNK